MLGATTTSGKLASDMYDLNYKTYYSEADGRDIPISHMDFQHLIRAFVKVNDKANYFKKVSEDNFITSVNDLDVISAKDNLIRKLNEKIERLEAIIEEKDEIIDKLSESELRWKKAYHNSVHINGHYYTFSGVPQDEEGKEFVRNCRKYLNKDSYNIRVKGQHLKKELYGQGKAYHGANMEDSTHMRVYIDTKKGDE
jgi:hypothetical protein